MDLIADMLLAAGALGAAVYCVVLSRRLSRFTDLQGGVGGAVAALSAQVDEMTRALERSRRAAGEQAGSLERSTRKATDVSRRLELLMASMHDIPAAAGPAPARPATPPADTAPRPEADAAREPDAEPKVSPPLVAPVAEDRAPEEAAPPDAPDAPASADEPEAQAPPADTAAPRPTAEPVDAWDDWDPVEVAAPPKARRTGDDPSAGPRVRPEATPAPAPAKGKAGRGGRSSDDAPRVGPPMPIFTAARPVARGAAPEPRLRAGQ